MDKWFGPQAEALPGSGLSHAEKQHQLFLRQKETLDLFLARGAISKTQHDKSLRDLREKMKETEEL